MSQPREQVSLHDLAERVCAAAGTDLASVLGDLRGTQHDPRTPAAIREGWAAYTITIPEYSPQESA